jgi:sterol desaturase/sphingolipid hydroxylase (fatty acid hydroxylase superfamily)
MHHSHPTGNYGLYFNWWDQLMGTNHPEYHRYFDGIKQWQVTASAPRPGGDEQIQPGAAAAVHIEQGRV